MTHRCVVGARNAGEFGLYLSKPGVNVFAAREDQLLISPSNRNLAFVVNGTIVIPRSQERTVLYGLDESLSDLPIVYAQFSHKQVGLVPAFQTYPVNLIGEDSYAYNPDYIPPRWSADPRTNRVIFRNRSTRTKITIRFLVLAEAQR